MSDLLRGIDAAWRRMDRDPQRMLITSIVELGGRVEPDALLAAVERGITPHPAFRMRVVDRGVLGLVFEPDPLFDPKNHLRRVALPSPGDDRALAELVSRLASTPLDSSRPLWDLTLVELPGRTTIVSRVHHCVADGVALVRVLLGMTDEANGVDVLRIPLPSDVGWSPPDPRDLRSRIRHVAEEGSTLVRTLLLPADPPSVLRGPLGARRQVAWTAPFAVSRAKRIARAVSGHVNDTLVAAVAGGLAGYARGRGAPLDREVRAMVPVFVRGHHDPSELGNAFGLVYLQLPTSIDDPLERLREAKRRMDAIKATSETSNAVMVLGLIGRLTRSVDELAIRLFTSKGTLVFTNVPGPPVQLRLAGQPIRSVVVFAPYAGELALSVTAVSHLGEFRTGVLANADVIPDPWAVAAAIERAFEDLDAAVTKTAGGAAAHA